MLNGTVTVEPLAVEPVSLMVTLAWDLILPVALFSPTLSPVLLLAVLYTVALMLFVYPTIS